MSRTLILLGLGLPFYLNAPKESYAQPKCEDSQLPDYGSEKYAYQEPPGGRNEVWAQTGGERRSPPCKPEPAKPADGGARAK
jgi:hypothetical protein